MSDHGEYPYPRQPQDQPGLPQDYPGYDGSYASALPPPVPYPSARRARATRRGWWIAIAVAVLAAVIGATFLGARALSRPQLTAATAKTAIQHYLDALVRQDATTIARNNLCGLYDGVKDHKPDLDVANMASDAFDRRFQRVDVTSIDAIVPMSAQQSQVLFTMKVIPTAGHRPLTPNGEIQGVAQLLTQPGQTLVCSYLPRPFSGE